MLLCQRSLVVQGFLTAMRQEVTRQHEQDRWALDDVVFHTEVLEYERVDQVRNPPREGVFVHGLFLDGAAWSRAESSVVESEPKRLFAPLPVLYVTAVTKAQQKVKQGDLGPFGGYEPLGGRRLSTCCCNTRCGCADMSARATSILRALIVILSSLSCFPHATTNRRTGCSEVSHFCALPSSGVCSPFA